MRLYIELTIDTKKAVFNPEVMYYLGYKQGINAQQRDSLTRHGLLCIRSRLGRSAINKNLLDDALPLPQTLYGFAFHPG